MRPEPSPELRAARRALDGLGGFVPLGDWSWHQSLGRWVLKCRLMPRDLPDHPLVPQSTDWYVHADPRYPWGTIRFYPAKEGGLAATFPHQNVNRPVEVNAPWRTGDLCLSTPLRVLGRHGGDHEPADAYSRLAWHVARALDWIGAAARDALLRPGDPYELPQLPGEGVIRATIAFAEDGESLALWDRVPDRVGLVILSPLRTHGRILLAREFQTVRGERIVAPVWGKGISERGESLLGIWVRVDGTPVLPAWQAPLTWSELRATCATRGTDLNGLLRRVTARLRDGKRHFALLGFPIPRLVGAAPAQMHWQALELPELSARVTHGPKAKPNESRAWHRDVTTVLRGMQELDWRGSQNWNVDELGARGRLPAHMRAQRLLLLGAGALGAPLGEMLVRGGMYDVSVLDGEFLGVGNLVRHTLQLQEIHGPKATALAMRLNGVSPHARATAMPMRFPPSNSDDVARVRAHDIILDCTASDEVLSHLETFPWEEAKLFVSVSIGYGGRRLLVFAAQERYFPLAAFQARIEPFLRLEDDEAAHIDVAHEGTGCWHPVFPARIDDVWLMASVAAKVIEGIVNDRPSEPTLHVFEQVHDETSFAGLRRIT